MEKIPYRCLLEPFYVYIDATKTGVTTEEILNFIKPQIPIINLLKEGVVRNLYIKSKGEWMKIM